MYSPPQSPWPRPCQKCLLLPTCSVGFGKTLWHTQVVWSSEGTLLVAAKPRPAGETLQVLAPEVRGRSLTGRPAELGSLLFSNLKAQQEEYQGRRCPNTWWVSGWFSLLKLVTVIFVFFCSIPWPFSPSPSIPIPSDSCQSVVSISLFLFC